MFAVPFSNPNSKPNPNPDLNPELNPNSGIDPGFDTEERIDSLEGAREQPLPRIDYGVSMGRRKKYPHPTNLNSSGKSEMVCWTPVMDEALIEAFVRQETLGNRASTGTFTSQAYDNIMRDLCGKFRDRPLDKERIKNRIKYIKRNFGPCYDIFKNGIEGFSWNPATKLWTAEPENWDRLIEVHPEAVEWMSKPVPHYDKLSLLFRPDREAVDYPERRKRDNSTEDNQIEGTEVMDGVTFEGLDGLNNLEGESCSSKKRARKVNKDQANVMILREGLDKIAEAITKSTAELVKSRQRLPIPEGQMWDLLVELGFEESVISTVYIFLIERPHMVGALLGCPQHKRKDVLIQMAFGASSSVPPSK
ncbi:hypothetical protein LUZ63_013459 [Rhynchospora breviuscula]|uniref:Myb/SANT-like domain-containing protein n=1 Tax=Rhynchospora breviuscula TaxID=2022672 RepID=A0A9Q0C8K9_9POAL|nr:hypothetical protein LUZ63_013459 [Rhynchospora breviuscula]